jgi:hypothetical protein
MIETIYMFKGIECAFSEKANALVPSEEEKIGLLETFFSYEPIDSIQWVDTKLFDDDARADELLPIYRISDDKNELLLWPVLNGSDLVLGIESAEERPDLSGASGEILVERGRSKTKREL